MREAAEVQAARMMEIFLGERQVLAAVVVGAGLEVVLLAHPVQMV
jgi:hypothetical protein